MKGDKVVEVAEICSDLLLFCFSGCLCFKRQKVSDS